MDSKKEEKSNIKYKVHGFLAPGGIAHTMIGVGKAKVSLSIGRMILLGILNLPRFTGHQDKTIIKQLEVQII